MMDFTKNGLPSLIVAEHEREFERRAIVAEQMGLRVVTRPNALRRLTSALTGLRPAAPADPCTSCAA